MNPLLLVTGGLGDIGAAIAHKFAASGWRVAVNDILPPGQGSAALRALIPTDSLPDGAEVVYFAGDNADRGVVEALVDELIGSMGVPRFAAVNAGIVERASFLKMSPENWQRHLNVNLTGAFHVAQVLAGKLVEHGTGGSIAFTGSWVQDVPSRNIGAYCVSKAGLKMLARQMALELAIHNVRVNVVAPGIVNAGLSKQMFRSGQADPGACVKAIPFHALQTAEQVADAFWLLAQPEAAYVTGATLLCDGGLSLYNWQEQ